MADKKSNKADKKSKENKDINNKQKSKAGQSALKRLGVPVRGRIFFAQILTVLSGILSIAPYVALTEIGRLLITSYQLGEMQWLEIWNACRLLILFFSLKTFLYFTSLLVTHFADLKLRNLLRRQIVGRMSKAPLSWFSESNSGLIRKAVQDDTQTVHTIIAHGPIDQLNAVVTPLSLLIYAFYVDWRLGLLSIATIPIHVLFYGHSMKGMPEKTAEMDTKLGKVSSTMVEFVSGITVVKAFGRAGKAHRNYLDAADEFTKFYHNWCIPLVSSSCLALSWISIPVLLLVNLGGGALLINAGYVDMAQVLTTTLIALELPQTLITLSSIAWAYQLAGSAGVRLCDVLDLKTLPETKLDKKPADSSIEFENVSFAYGETEALKDVDLKLPQGTVSALIGPSGSGKTTLATLIARFNDPDLGSVKIGGVDIKDMSEDTLYNQVAFVLQDAQLLNISIRENICLGRPDASYEDMVKAAKAAQIHDYIETLPKSYDTVLGTDTKFSGGQEQRLAIARAILINAPVLLLDEATAFADPESEAEIQKALSYLIKDRTVLVIAHRPGAIQGADKLIIMENGKISDEGRHEELLGNAHYRALLKQSTKHEVVVK
ncbi:MAG TPA: ABC transporter ATP-binding protein [Clostridiaceae bacterium]|nr:ABC transporter ATP-binding protein [Clostridiaceae bacterium]